MIVRDEDREESCREKFMHNEDNDFMHGRKIEGGKDGMDSCTVL